MLLMPLFLLSLLLFTSQVVAANSVMIWPIDPVIDAEQKASELWLENRGDATTLMQVRIFSWQQVNHQDQYQTQQQIVATPPLVRIEPGQKQLIRLIKQSPPANGTEQAFRVVLDEIPVPRAPGTHQAGLSFQMRYSVPLFVYGSGLSADSARPDLQWRVVNEQGHHWLEMNNHGNGHARLSNPLLGGRKLGEGLYGYVLAHATYRWPLKVPASGVLESEVNKGRWRSAASH